MDNMCVSKLTSKFGDNCTVVILQNILVLGTLLLLLSHFSHI